MVCLLSDELLIAMYAFNLGLVCLLFFFDKRETPPSLAWSLILIFVPVIGLIAYLLVGFGPLLGAKQRFLSKLQNDGKYLQPAQDLREILEGSGLKEEVEELINFNQDNKSLFSVCNEAQIFSDVGEFYQDMLYEIEKATSFIHVEFFSIKNDEAGRKLINALAKKAFEGLKVRVLYDDIGCAGLRKKFFQCISRSGGEVEAFYPSKLKWFNWNASFRNHRKMLIIDGVCVYTGVSNTGSEYKLATKSSEHWVECNIKIRGDAAAHYNLRFLRDFAFASGRRVETESIDHGVKNHLPIQVLCDGPDTTEHAIKHAYLKGISSAKKRVYVQIPYLLPDDEFKLALIDAAKRGVDVKVMIPSKPDKGYVYLAGQAYAAELSKAGVKVYMRKGYLRCKTLLVDDGVSSIGAFNMDSKSYRLKFEIASIIYGEEFAGKLEQVFSDNLKHCVFLDNAYLSKKGFMRLATERVMKLLSPLL